MADHSNLLRILGGIATNLAPLIPGGGAIVGIGTQVIEALSVAKQGHAGPLPPEATEGESALMAQVRAHAESTFDRAEHGDG
jgi:hypothetical protein